LAPPRYSAQTASPTRRDAGTSNSDRKTRNNATITSNSLNLNSLKTTDAEEVPLIRTNSDARLESSVAQTNKDKLSNSNSQSSDVNGKHSNNSATIRDAPLNSSDRRTRKDAPLKTNSGSLRTSAGNGNSSELTSNDAVISKDRLNSSDWNSSVNGKISGVRAMSNVAFLNNSVKTSHPVYLRKGTMVTVAFGKIQVRQSDEMNGGSASSKCCINDRTSFADAMRGAGGHGNNNSVGYSNRGA